jgi:hypothetical protein
MDGTKGKNTSRREATRITVTVWDVKSGEPSVICAPPKEVRSGDVTARCYVVPGVRMTLNNETGRASITWFPEIVSHPDHTIP